MKIPQTKITSDYSLFIFEPANRDIGNYQKVLESMRENGWLSATPLATVQEGRRLLIKDGQNRFVAAKELGLPILYVVDERYRDISLAKLQRAVVGPWQPKDYLKFHRVKGNEHYQRLESFVQETGFTIRAAAALLWGDQAGSSNVRDRLVDGTFAVRDEPYARTVARLSAAVGRHVKWSRQMLFLDALSKAVRIPEFDPEVFLDRLEHSYGKLKLCPTSDAYLANIEEIYNTRSRDPLSLVFAAQQAAKARNAVKRAKSKGKEVGE